ncbi:MAG: SGNH/GDSL hydrolase family protein [Ignavibacteria bacterium]|nr:SGNH/GDSL hydrolase family protein [Ignavibacteria bacterium]
MTYSQQTKKILALGDSYTIGEAVSENERFPSIVVSKLSAEGINVNDPVIIAKTGWTTDELEKAIDEAELKEKFDLVTLLIGVNNQYRGRSPGQYRTEFRELLYKAIEFAGGKQSNVLVISIPDWGVTPFAEGRDRKKISEEIDNFNSVNREETEKAGAVYAYITDISREAASDPELTAQDGLHPSRKMYEKWVESFYPVIKKIINN